jgi:hypothetical protein
LQPESSSYSVLIADLLLRNATFTESFNPITPDLLANFTVLWTRECASWDPSEIAAVAVWVNDGGSIVFEGDQSPAEFNDILQALDAGLEYSFSQGTPGVTTRIFPHETTRDVQSILIGGPLSQLTNITAPAEVLVEDAAGAPNTAYSRVGVGRVVALADENFSDFVIASDDNQLFANQVFDWLATALWLDVEPNAGSVPPGGRSDVAVTFDATGLVGGDYESVIVVRSNDPLTPELSVPPHMHVTGAPDIVVEPAAIDFGDLFIGAAHIEGLTVSNAGTDLLTVSDLLIDNADFSSDSSSFTLAPGETGSVAVTFAPANPGPSAGTLTFVSDDPDEANLEVPLQGVGVSPPIVGVTPDSLQDALLTGQTSSQVVQISNSGVADLEFGIVFVSHDGSGEAGSKSPRVGVDAAPPPAFGTGFSWHPQPTEVDAARFRARYAEQIDAATPGLELEHGESSPLSVQSARPDLFHRIRNIVLSGTILFEDDMESGATGWTHYSTHPNNIDQWALTTQRASSGITSWNVSQHSSFGSDAVQSPPIDLTRVQGATLTFMHWWNFDDCSDPMFESDGGIVEASSDGGSTWTQIFPVGGYPYTLDDICSNPLAFLEAYAHDGGDGDLFVPAVFDLTAFAGQEIALRFHAGWDCGNCALNEGWYIDDVVVTSTGPVWLRAAPESGVVAAGETADVIVTFDATGLAGGDYEADVLVLTNDPLTPEWTVNALLQVTGAADIAIAPSSLDFGDVFTVVTREESLLVSNIGVEVLNVSDIASDHPDFTVSSPVATLAPGESQVVVVSFSPSSAGAIAATLTITSDDPDEPSLVVPLTGIGVPPPVVEVQPESLSADLLTDETQTQDLTIQNTGGSDLHWEIGVQFFGQQARAVYTLTPPNPYASADAADGNGSVAQQHAVRTEPLEAPLADLSGMAILWDRSHSQGTPSVWSTIIADLLARNATFTESFDPVTPALLSQYTVLWMRECSAWSTDEIATLVEWVENGGAIVFDGDQSVTEFNDILAALGAGVEYASGGIEGITTQIFPHETTLNVESINIAAPLAQLTNVTSPAAVLVADTAGNPNTAYSLVGRGKIVALADENFVDGTIGTADNQLFANQIFDWLHIPAWLSVDPAAGTVAPAGSIDVAVEFDATGLFGGDYDAEIVVSHNDPLREDVSVAVGMHVTGVPDIVVDPLALDFGEVFVVVSRTESLLVTNRGTDVLNVTDIQSDHVDFAPDVTSFSLDIGQSRFIHVTFSPATDTAIMGTLTIQSDDPDEPEVLIAMSGTGVLPPVISVEPESLSADLFTGEATTRVLSVFNNGESNLDFQALARSNDANVVVHESMELAKDEADPRVGEPVTEGSGGPDAFGYRWIDSDEPGGPTFAWVDISGVGSVAISNADDINVGPFPIGFEFPFYGNNHTEFRVCSNGFISFTSSSWEYLNQPIPNPGAPAHLVAPFWDDLVVGNASTVYWHNDGTRLIVQYDNVEHYFSGGPYTFQVILHQNGSIDYQYLSMADPKDDATIGIQNGTGTDGLQVAFNTAYVHVGSG